MTRILVADDERIIRRGIQVILEDGFGEDVQVKLAGNGEEALEMAKEWKPQILITDIRMPGMDGLQLMEHLREMEEGMIFIVLSGYDDFAFCKRALKNKAADYLLKPVDEQELLYAVGQAIAAVTAGPAEERDFPAGRSKNVQTMLEYVKTHYAEPLNLEILAEQMHFNARYLSQLFKKETGVNFVDYLNRVRIERAKVLLRQSDATVEEVAARVGYRDARYFAKTFKKLENETPSGYRNRTW